MTKTIMDAIELADVYAVVSKGWSDRLASEKKPMTSPLVDDAKAIEALKDKVYHVGSIPHDWLFPQIDVAVHHGGAGSTGASLGAGIPTIIRVCLSHCSGYSHVTHHSHSRSLG